MMIIAVTEKGRKMRLIDADELKERLKEYCIDGDKGIEEYYEIMGIDDCIDNAPTVDAVSREKYEAREESRKILVKFADDLLAELKERVEVVRCKDCKHRDPEDKKCDCGMWHIPYVTKDDDFCSYGERKKE